MSELSFTVPPGEDMPTEKPGELLQLYRCVDGREVPGFVRIVRVEGRTVVFENVTEH